MSLQHIDRGRGALKPVTKIREKDSGNDFSKDNINE
jgi:hypothetical protein